MSWQFVSLMSSVCERWRESRLVKKEVMVLLRRRSICLFCWLLKK